MRLVTGSFVFALAAVAGSVSLYDQEDRRSGTVKESPGGRVDVFDAESNRMGWGRVNRDGSVELFGTDGRRLGTIMPGQRRDGARMPLVPGWAWDSERSVPPQKGGRR